MSAFVPCAFTLFAPGGGWMPHRRKRAAGGRSTIETVGGFGPAKLNWKIRNHDDCSINR